MATESGRKEEKKNTSQAEQPDLSSAQGRAEALEAAARSAGSAVNEEPSVHEPQRFDEFVAGSPIPRFYVEEVGSSWCVRDREIVIPLGPMRGQAHIVQWCRGQAQAEEVVSMLNATRSKASDEPRCVDCGAQPAGGNPPRCAACHSRLARGE